MRARRRLWVLLEGGPAEPWLTEHLRQCPECAGLAAQLRREGDALSGAAGIPPMPDPDALWARIDARLPQRHPLRWLALAPVAPVLAAALWAVRAPAPPPTAHPNTVAQTTRGGAEQVVPSLVAPRVGESRVSAGIRHPASRRCRTATRTHGLSGTRAAAPAPGRSFAPTPATKPPAAVPEDPVETPAPETPVSAVVVVRAPSAIPETPVATAAFDRTICRSESRDPVSGAVTRTAVSRETDPWGTTHLTIECVVQSADELGASGESET